MWFDRPSRLGQGSGNQIDRFSRMQLRAYSDMDNMIIAPLFILQCVTFILSYYFMSFKATAFQAKGAYSAHTYMLYASPYAH